MMHIRFVQAGCALLLSAQVFANDALNQSVDQVQAQQQRNAQSQIKIDQLHDEQREALQEFRSVNNEIEQLEVYNQQLREIIGNQNTQISSLTEQIKTIEKTQEGIMPLMQRMIDGLEQFIELDLPFLQVEREQRVANLRGLLVSADSTVSEKFRRVLEAYQIELEYGRTIEAYRAKNEQDITVDFLRLGRNALYQLDLNAESPKHWDNEQKVWVDLSGEYARQVQKGIRIARQQSAPELLTLPLPKLQGVNRD